MIHRPQHLGHDLGGEHTAGRGPLRVDEGLEVPAWGGGECGWVRRDEVVGLASSIDRDLEIGHTHLAMSTAVEYAEPPTAPGRPWLASKRPPSGVGRKPLLPDHLKELPTRPLPSPSGEGATRAVFPHAQRLEDALLDEGVDVLPRHLLGSQRQEAVVVVALGGVCLYGVGIH